MNILIYGHSLKQEDVPFVEELIHTCEELGIVFKFYAPFLELFCEKTESDPQAFKSFTEVSVEKSIKAMICLGGDGTILAATTLIGDTGIPIMGINLGRLGFLASIEKKRIKKAVWLFANDMFSLEDRQLIYLESNLPVFGQTPFALNDFTITKRDNSSMIVIHTFINGDFLNTYWADGIIVATPTGSTGYSLSCGGPIIFPNSGNFVITPVAPHNLNVRPIVISDTSVISFQIEGRSENYLCTLDSRFETITKQHQLAARKADFAIKLIKLHDITFLKTIRNKLNWGIDFRN